VAAIRNITGIWFIPQTVVLLGSFLFAELAPTGPAAAQRGLAVLAVALLGAGGLLFALTAVIFVNRLVLHVGVHTTGAPAMWIMISPLAVTSLAMQSVAGGDPMLGGSWTPAVAEVATFGAGALWGFANLVDRRRHHHHPARRARRADPDRRGLGLRVPLRRDGHRDPHSGPAMAIRTGRGRRPGPGRPARPGLGRRVRRHRPRAPPPTGWVDESGRPCRCGPDRPPSDRTDPAHNTVPGSRLRAGHGRHAPAPEAGQAQHGDGSSTTTMTRPVSFDIEDYKHGNVVERFFKRKKNWRGLVSRYDKLAVVFHGSVVLAAIVDWLR
jgi:hypothetical protein